MAHFKFVQWLVKYFESREFEFDWDEGNESKNFQKHGISNQEAEEAFYDPNLAPLGVQISPVINEERFGIIGKDFSGNILFIAFTFRKLKIRIISVRNANSREKMNYEK